MAFEEVCVRNLVAGMGKSAIAQMFAGNIHAAGRLGASFFFQRGDAKRGTWHSLIPTIACQLAASVPDLRSPIQQAIEGDKFVVGRTLAVAFQRLLVEPFKGIPDTQTHPVIILDGVDECAEHKVQQQILRLFISAIRDHKLPIWLIIVSRPEPHLREVFETLETFGLCCEYRVSADLAALDDIRKYLTDEFSRIHAEYIARGVDLGPVWPPPDTVPRLVIVSSGWSVS
ncbi:hypothetical protein B0H13DRAFT_1709889 [Mycena leptocephala]|nr:hypothetical protein B0H13DRAFT_1709889 [Mycena leptocephala]